MTDNPLFSFFPETETITEIRINQLEALDKLWKLIEIGTKNITLSAPTGAGKSAIADTLFNYYNSIGLRCLYTSPLNTLVDQVESSGFQNIATLVGRKHYPCLVGREDCSKGFCRTDKCPDLEHRDCKNNPYDTCYRCPCWSCIYKKVFAKFRDSRKGNTNFTLFMMGVTNNPDVVVIDEADTIEETIRDHHSVTIPVLIDNANFYNHIKPLREYVDKLNTEAGAINPDDSDAAYKKQEELYKLSGKISMMLEDFERNKEPWVVTVKPIAKKTQYQPITINRFLEPLLQGKTVIMMSATPPFYKGYSRIEVDSIFPIETRQWQYIPLGRMSMNYRDKTIPKLAIWLSKLRGKTLVHCVSYLTAQKIAEPLRMLGINPYLQVTDSGFNDGNSNHDHNVSRYDAIKAFVDSIDVNKILLSVKLDRGVDFWQPDILNNVIAVLPYPSPVEPLTKAKNQLLGQNWQAEEMARTIAQSMGRIFRNEKMGILDGKPAPKRGYIIDSNFGFWYAKNKKLFPKWFRESQLKL